MQPAVLAAVVLPGAQDVDAVKRTQQLAGAPERLKNLHQASASACGEPLDSRAAQGWGQRMHQASATYWQEQAISQQQCCTRLVPADARQVVSVDCIMKQGLA